LFPGIETAGKVEVSQFPTQNCLCTGSGSGSAGILVAVF
jgi:hypothetical protein